jgi:hypothetical protein
MMDNQQVSDTGFPRLRSISEQIVDPMKLIYKQWAPLLITQAIIIFATAIIVVLGIFVFMMPVFYGLFNEMSAEKIIESLFSSYFWIGMFFIFVPVMIIGAWGYAAMIKALSYRQERMAPIGETLKSGLQLLPPMLVLIVVNAAAMFGASLMLFFPAIILAVGLSLAWYIRVLENVTIWEAIGTSWEITRGYRWSIFGRLMLFMLIVWGILFTLTLAQMVPIMGLTAIPIQFALNFIITPYAFAYFFCIYEDLRAVRKGVYPIGGGLSVFMIISCILTVVFVVGIILATVYLIQTQM